MKITFLSNFLNHHQLPFCLEIMKMKDVDFKFVATEPIEEGRIKLGYEDMNKKYDFVVRSYEEENGVYELVNNSDVVIVGSAPKKYIKQRLKNNKLTFRYSERIFKSGFDLKTWLSLIKNYSINERKCFLLCASAYSAFDFNRSFCYRNRAYKWGYFPEIIEYDINKILNEKSRNEVIQLLWVGRFIWWKHPEKAIYVAKKLSDLGINFKLKMVGIGDKIAEIKELIKVNKLEKKVELVGSVNYKMVRKYMEQANIFLFTSDYNEGWGAVLNEAMNSGCAVIASHAIGSVPFMIDHMKNGVIYNDSDTSDLFNKVIEVINNKDLQYKLGYNAYNSIIKTWNAHNAAANFLKLIDAINNQKNLEIKDGPCSKALPISNKRMYNYLMRNKDDSENI